MTARFFIIYGVALCLISSAAGETIHLKNGRTIMADSVRQDGDRLEYSVGDNTYAIPRSSVQGIETGGASSSSSPAAAIEIPQAEVKSDVTSVWHADSGQVTPELLEQLEKLHDPRTLASALLYAARQEQKQGKLSDARDHLQRALDLFPNDPALLSNYVSVLLQSDRAAVAVKFAQQACREAPDSADAHTLLGLAYFKNDQSKEAIAEWKKSVEIRDDPLVQSYLARAEREVAHETNYSQQASAHFALRYEGKQSSEAFRKQLLDTLEAHYNALVNQLGVLPRDSIAVVLYTNQAFFDVTQSPSWTAALNDGKLRIPIEGVESITPEMSRVLKHELAHSFINQASRGRCPHWLNEGIAQMVEPQSAAPFRRALARVYVEHRNIPLEDLNAGFLNFSTGQAEIAYAESLAITEYLRNTYGSSSINTILQRLNEGQNIDGALRSAVHSDEQQLEEEFIHSLTRDYQN